MIKALSLLIPTIILSVLLVVSSCAVPINVDLHSTNAWSTQDSVIITSKMSQLMETRGELAFVMAHELGHIILLHHGQRPSDVAELDADHFAFQAMELAGHSPCFGVTALRKIAVSRLMSNKKFNARLSYWTRVYPTCVGELE